MKVRLLVAGVAMFCLAAASLVAADPKLEGVKCLVNPKAPAKAEKSVDYKGGKVFFCCDNCPKAFAKDTAKFATKANLQLVQTGQAKQEKCPFSGADLNPDTAVKVGGVEVKFCCEKCQGKAKAASADEAVDLVFNDKAFDKGFKVAK
jgi:YHS domain-containing protein